MIRYTQQLFTAAVSALFVIVIIESTLSLWRLGYATRGHLLEIGISLGMVYALGWHFLRLCRREKGRNDGD